MFCSVCLLFKTNCFCPHLYLSWLCSQGGPWPWTLLSLCVCEVHMACVCTFACTPQCTCVGQRTFCRVYFLLSLFHGFWEHELVIRLAQENFYLMSHLASLGLELLILLPPSPKGWDSGYVPLHLALVLFPALKVSSVWENSPSLWDYLTNFSFLMSNE